MRKYRVIEVRLGNGETYFMIQRQMKLFGITTRWWKTFDEEDDGYYWRIAQRLGTYFETTKAALDALHKLEHWYGSKIVEQKTVEEYEKEY